MKKLNIFNYILISTLLFMIYGCNVTTQQTQQENNISKPIKLPKDYYSPEEVDNYAYKLLDVNISDSNSSNPVVGNWYGKAHYMQIALRLNDDGTYKYKSILMLGKYHNEPRTTEYNGTWSIENSNSQIVLKLQNVDAPLVLTNNFPTLYSPAGINLYSGTEINTSIKMDINQSQNNVTASYTQNAQDYMDRNVSDYGVSYFTMVAAKANSEQFWDSVDMKPAGFNYGHKFTASPDFDYAKQRIEDDPNNYTIVISDENWQTLIGNRHSYTKDIQKPDKMYRWLEYFKDQMQILGKIKGTVIYIIAGDAPAYWASDVRLNHNNDAKTIPAKLIESRFPEVLERDPSNSFAGVFQMMDYLRMKYAPNVKLSYTIKTWGIAEKDIYHEPSDGWDNQDTVKVMAEYLNNFDVQFDLLSFNYHPRSSHTTDEYKSAAKYFGAISKQLKIRKGNKPKLWIWKLSLWNQEQTSFIFSNIDFLVDDCNAIGVTLGHGNDLKGKTGFSDNPDNDIYIQSWIKEYFNGERNDNIPIHATPGLIYWR